MKSYFKKYSSLLFVFVFFMFFYLVSHPITIFDADDWLYISFSRQAIPILGEWNPARVFPEVSMQLLSLIASKTIFPLNNDFVLSLSIVFAFAVTISIVFLTFLINRYFYKKNNIDIFGIYIITFFFFICNFIMFKKGEGNWDYLLSTSDACTYFYYVIPNLLNCSLVIIFELDEDIKQIFVNKKIIKKSLYIILIYFCIFSNLFASAIFASYIGSKLLISFINYQKIRQCHLAILLRIMKLIF